MLPFALALAVSFGVVSGLLVSRVSAIGIGAMVFLVALGWWYGWPMRQRRPAEPEQADGHPTAVESKIEHTLTEARMVLPGAQALLGFQFASFFAEAFLALPHTSQLIHLAALGCVALASVLLIAPAAYHRLAEHGDATPRFYQYASRLVQASLVPLGLGMATDLYVVVTNVFNSSNDGLLASAASVTAMFALWFAYPLAMRHRRTRAT